MKMRVDAHQHFCWLDRDDVQWIRQAPELASLCGDFSPERLAALLATYGIGRTILVQAAPSLSETKYLLAIACQTSFVAGVVGWIDFDAPGALATVGRLADNDRLVGLRPMLQDIEETDWILRPARAVVLQRMAERGLTFDARIELRHLGAAYTLARRYPQLSIVIDHAAKPAIADRVYVDWQDAMTELSHCENVFCKLSGLVTEASRDWQTEDLRPYVAHFGSERLIWGSDWPVVNLAGDYSARWKASQKLLAPLAAAEREGILGANAARFCRSGVPALRCRPPLPPRGSAPGQAVLGEDRSDRILEIIDKTITTVQIDLTGDRLVPIHAIGRDKSDLHDSRIRLDTVEPHIQGRCCASGFESHIKAGVGCQIGDDLLIRGIQYGERRADD